MATLLQRLLIETLSSDEKDSVLGNYIDTVLPHLEDQFSLTPALGGSKKNQFANKADQSLLSHILNGLITAWNLSQLLPNSLTETEQYLLCLGFTLHDYTKIQFHQGETPLTVRQIKEIINYCQKLGRNLHFISFWKDWENHILDICYLAQNTQKKEGSNRIASLWESEDYELQLDTFDLDHICELLTFGDVAIHAQHPSDLLQTSMFHRLTACLENLGLEEDYQLTYHSLKDCRGIITNKIHNSVLNFAEDLAWKPLLFFAEGAVYLAPKDSYLPDKITLRKYIWNNIIEGNIDQKVKGLLDFFKEGEVGFTRDGKGLKIAPLSKELFTPSELIKILPQVIIENVKNVKNPATPKRLEKLDLSPEEKQKLMGGADIWSDRLAELVIRIQQEFFGKNDEFIEWVLSYLKLTNTVTIEQVKINKGGVNYGWYLVASHYIKDTPYHRELDSQELPLFLNTLAQNVAEWAEEKGLLSSYPCPTQEQFFLYLDHYLELSHQSCPIADFSQELTQYQNSKNNNKPLCSISSGEFIAEEQLDAVVLFKPQQYSNKNPLGGGKIKRGISKIWSLEMILRQALWGVSTLEDQQPIFLYIFPPYVYSPQTARAVGRIVNSLKKINIWEIRKQWLESDQNYRSLKDLLTENGDPKSGRSAKQNYQEKDIPFMAMTYTKTMGKTYTEAWIEPAFLSLILPLFLGVKVVATPSGDPLYSSDRQFLETVRLDGVAGWWNLMGLPTTLRLQDIGEIKPLERLLIAYSLHLDNRGNPPDGRWQSFSNTVKEVMTNVLNIFAIAEEGLRNKREHPSSEEIKRYWNYAQLWAEGDLQMQETLSLTQQLTYEYRLFYKVNSSESSHARLLPLSKTLEVILKSPYDLPIPELIPQCVGQIYDAIDRQEVYKRPFLSDKSIDYQLRKDQELLAIQTFVSTFINQVFGKLYKFDRALLQENTNRLKSGVEACYRYLDLQERGEAKTASSQPPESINN